MDPVKIGIIGFGKSANCFHLPFILPNKDIEVYAFLQRAPASAAKTQMYGHCTDKYPQAKHYQTAKSFFADPNIEVVIVTSTIHETFAKQALEAGKHVAVEKPFTPSTAIADELIALAKAKGKILTVFQNRRLDSDFRTVQHLLAQNALGDVLEAEIHIDVDPPAAPWTDAYVDKAYEPGLGSIFEVGSHTLDQALTLFGKPAFVTAFMRSYRDDGTFVDADVHDSYTLVLEYDGAQKGQLVTVKTNIASVMKDQLRFWVRGKTGTFLKFGLCPQADRALASPSVPADDPLYGTENERIWGTLTTKTKVDASQTLDDDTGFYTGKYPSLPGYYRGYYENLVDAVRGKAEIAVKPEQSRAGIRLMELARQSHETRATVAWSE
ncbi:oxidoreductase domain-containing protein [Ophiostoma piceae UAMH 11346]|uniref:Oxidoreductase domain-containing protein n=1 Tax=Ophiostoma piceae (strain UAMH 11346) TaxID=1262450 RepID=S3C8Z3_OPHP1|nr:oxidoreductase domain-containing protein [Ophiostoma piceae UAMH 11346]